MEDYLYKDWRTLKIAVIDTETTGLDEKKNRLTEVGIVYFVNGKPKRAKSTLINPGQKIPEIVVEKTHITDAMVATKKPFEKSANKIAARLNNCDVWCMFNDYFDRKFLRAEFHRAGVKYKEKMVIDPLIFAQFVNPSGPNTLDAVSTRYRVNVLESILKKFGIQDVRHRAVYDALITGLVLFDMQHMLPKTLMQLLCVQNWCYSYWLLNSRSNNEKYVRKMLPTLPFA